ncbi:hypothetical protein ABKN59_009683 [Abortiporus biennis]
MDPNFHSWMTIIELATAISNILGSGNIDTERRKKFGYLLITLNPESTHTISLRAWPLHVDDSSIDLFSFSKGLSFSYIREITKKFAEILNFNTIRILEINATQGKPFRVISPEDPYQWAWLGVLSSITSRQLDVLHFNQVLRGVNFEASGALEEKDLIRTQLKRRLEAGVPIETLVIETGGRDEMFEWFSPYVTVGVVDIETTSCSWIDQYYRLSANATFMVFSSMFYVSNAEMIKSRT